MKFKLLSTPFSICMIVLSPICSCTWDLLICPDWFSHLVLIQIAIMCHLQVCLIIILRHHVNLSSVICSSCSVSRVSHHIHTPPTIVYCIYMTPYLQVNTTLFIMPLCRWTSGLYADRHHGNMLSVIFVCRLIIRSIWCPSSGLCAACLHVSRLRIIISIWLLSLWL